jgi:Holliday junction resolvase RusA-like endonuclease
LTYNQETVNKEQILKRSRMILFEIHTIPKPQKQTLYGKRRFYDPSKEYKQALQWQMRPYAPKEPLEGPVKVHIHFYMPMPKDVTAPKRRQMINGIIVPCKRPDLDNLAYSVTNAMNELIYADDSQIIDLTLSKRYSENPKIVVKIIELQLAQNSANTQD